MNFFKIIETQRLLTLLKFGLPIMAGMISQNLINIVDTVMLGHLGKEELAAVGISAITLSAIQALSFGVSDGVQALASKAVASGNNKYLGKILSSGLCYSILFGGIVLLCSLFLNNIIFEYIGLEGKVFTYASSYLFIRGCSSIFASGNFAFRGFWNGIGESKFYFKILVMMHLTNLILNSILIYGYFGFPAMGIEGAALATTISITLGFFTFLIASHRHYPLLKTSLETFKQIFKLSSQSGLELLITLAAMTTLFSMIDNLGTISLAAANILSTLFLFILFPVIGLGVAVSSLAGRSTENYHENVWSWIIHGIVITIVFVGALTTFGALFSDQLLFLFTNIEAVTEKLKAPFYLICLSLPIEMVGYLIAQSFLSLGEPKKVLKITSTMLWGFFIPATYLAILVYKKDLFDVWIIMSLYRIIQTVWFLWEFRKCGKNSVSL